MFQISCCFPPQLGWWFQVTHVSWVIEGLKKPARRCFEEMNHMFSCTKPRRLGEIQTSSLKQEDTFPLSPSGWLARHASTQSKWCTVHIEYAPNTYKLVYKLLRCTGSTINPSVNLVTSKVSRVWGCMGPQNPFFSGLIPIFFMLKPAILLRSSCLRLQWRHFAYCIICIHICYHTLHHMLGDDSLWIPSILLLRTPGYCSSWGHICSCRSEVRFLQGEAPFGQENIENQQSCSGLMGFNSDIYI
jgi:hypothetical protein